MQASKLYMLQCRSGKRTGAAAVRIAVEMLDEGLVADAAAAVHMVTPDHLDQLLPPQGRKPIKENTTLSRTHTLGHGCSAAPEGTASQLKTAST